MTYVEYDHDDDFGHARYQIFVDGECTNSIMKTPGYNGKPEVWKDHLLAFFDKLPAETSIHVGSHVTAETVGDIVERLNEIGRDR